MPFDTVLWAKDFWALPKGMRARPLKLVCLAGVATLAAAIGADSMVQVAAIAMKEKGLTEKAKACKSTSAR